ncbi:hypothetical protein [Jeotgalibaca porci]|uniref:hypothetical protein n=1 Tax=Jeotgalibaca porci TaxID=1868793 RepID=UPI0035A1C40D
MKNRIVSKMVIDVISQLGSASIYNSSKKTLQDKAKNTLDGYKKGQWNSGYTTSIEKNMGDIKAIANGEKVRYKVAEIFRDGETDVMEIEECEQ